MSGLDEAAGPGAGVTTPPAAAATATDTAGTQRAAGARRGRPAKPKRPGHVAAEWAILVVAALVIALVVKAYVFQAFYIPSESMVPTLRVGDRVLVNKLSYQLHDPHRGDIVVFKAPRGAETADIKDLVKRIVGMPGDTLETRTGHVFINSKELREPYLAITAKSVMSTVPPGCALTAAGDARAVCHIPRDGYFVMGDNRAFSKDSRVFGPIKRSAIVGRVFVRIWPITHLGFL